MARRRSVSNWGLSTTGCLQAITAGRCTPLGKARRLPIEVRGVFHPWAQWNLNPKTCMFNTVRCHFSQAPPGRIAVYRPPDNDGIAVYRPPVSAPVSGPLALPSGNSLIPSQPRTSVAGFQPGSPILLAARESVMPRFPIKSRPSKLEPTQRLKIGQSARPVGAACPHLLPAWDWEIRRARICPRDERASFDSRHWARSASDEISMEEPGFGII